MGTFTVTYLSVAVSIKSSEILGLLLGAHAIHACLVPLVGKITDIVGRNRPTWWEFCWLAPGLLRLQAVLDGRPVQHLHGDVGRPGVPRLHARSAVGYHVRKGPHPYVQLRSFVRLPGHGYRCRVLRADHRGVPYGQVRLGHPDCHLR